MRTTNLLALVLVLTASAYCLAGDLADEPNALQRRPNYATAVQKLGADIKALPDWVEPMKQVHAKFKGKAGIFCCFGDSLTQQEQFWRPLKDGGKNMDDKMKVAYELVKARMDPKCWEWKGSKYGNEGGTTSQWGRDNIDKWLKEYNPEACVLLFGDNDMDRPDSDHKFEQYYKDWKEATEQIITKCLDNGTVVIIETIPPRRGSPCDVYSETLIKFAAKYKLPVCDMLGETIARRPTDWDGHNMKEFQDRSKRFEAPTIICGDGEHLSCPKAFNNDYSEEALKTSGCNLRTYLTLLSYADVIHKVFEVPLPEAGK